MFAKIVGSGAGEEDGGGLDTTSIDWIRHNIDSSISISFAAVSRDLKASSRDEWFPHCASSNNLERFEACSCCSQQASKLAVVRVALRDRWGDICCGVGPLGVSDEGEKSSFIMSWPPSSSLFSSTAATVVVVVDWGVVVVRMLLLALNVCVRSKLERHRWVQVIIRDRADSTSDRRLNPTRRASIRVLPPPSLPQGILGATEDRVACRRLHTAEAAELDSAWFLFLSCLNVSNEQCDRREAAGAQLLPSPPPDLLEVLLLF